MSVLNYFKNIPGRSPIGRQALSVIFFLQICNEVPGEKKGGCRPPSGDQWARPTSAAGGPVAPPRATGGLPFFSPGTSLQIWRKKITLWACRPMGERPGYIFEILLFLNIKKKKPQERVH